jgi:riboflavin kinase/FMN adenylyltransferase
LKVVITNLINVKPFERDTVLCLGFFDGVHRGHQALIEAAKATKLDVAVLTFDRSPKTRVNTPLLTTIQDRMDIFEKMGVAVTLLVIFDEVVKELTAEQFIDSLNRLKVKRVFCGPDFHFGFKASGDATMLKFGIGRDFQTTIVEEVLEGGQKIATSRIIKHLQYGNVAVSARMLGRPYAVRGTVIKGRGNGRRFGYPTANLALTANYALPLNGVYATAVVLDGKRYYSMTNVGYNPTISPLEMPIVETHIFDFNRKIYKKPLIVEFLQFMRPEIKFSSPEELIARMQQDEKDVRAIKGGLFK